MILVPVNVVRIVDIARVLLVNVGRHPVHDLHCLLVIALVVQDIPQQTGRYGQGTVDTGVLRLVVGPPPDASAQVIAPASLPHDVEMLHRHVQELLVSGAVVSPRAGDGHPGDVIVVLVPGPVPSMLLLEPLEDFPDHFIISLIPGMLIGVDHHLVHLRRLPEKEAIPHEISDSFGHLALKVISVDKSGKTLVCLVLYRNNILLHFVFLCSAFLRSGFFRSVASRSVASRSVASCSVASRSVASRSAASRFVSLRTAAFFPVALRAAPLAVLGLPARSVRVPASAAGRCSQGKNQQHPQRRPFQLVNKSHSFSHLCIANPFESFRLILTA